MCRHAVLLNCLGATIAHVALLSGCTDSPKQPPVAHAEPGGHSHGSATNGQPSAELIISSKPEMPRANEPVELQLMLHDASGQMLMLKDFEPTHEKLAHLIIIREGLDEYAHVHPTVEASGQMRVAHTFPVGGIYLVFLDYKPTGKPATTAQGLIIVEGKSPSAPKLKPDVPGIVRGDGLQANVTLREEGGSRVVVFDVQDPSGQTVNDLEPYLGAMGHLVVLSADGQQYVHAHPLTGTAPDGTVEFEVHFPGPGVYKMWGQFQRGGQVFTIPAVVKVEQS